MKKADLLCKVSFIYFEADAAHIPRCINCVCWPLPLEDLVWW